MSVTPQLYYKLCVVEGACLAVGLGIPFLLHPVTHTNESGLPELVSFVMTFFGTWGLLTAGTGIVFLSNLREHFRSSHARLYTVEAKYTETGAKAQVPPAPSLGSTPRPGLTLLRDEEDDDSSSDSPAWKANWRRRSQADGKSFPIKTGSE